MIRLISNRLREQGQRWGGKAPSNVPVPAMLWLHAQGIQPDHRDLPPFELREADDEVSLHLDLRFDWRTEGDSRSESATDDSYLEGWTILIGSAGDLERVKSETNFAADLKSDRQPRSVNDARIQDGRVIAPGDPGNESGESTYARYDLVAELQAIPSRVRTGRGTENYAEFLIDVESVGDAFSRWDREIRNHWRGRWGLTESAGPFADAGDAMSLLLTRHKGMLPYWVRHAADLPDEVGDMPEWQRPSLGQIERTLEVSPFDEADRQAQSEAEQSFG